MRMKCFGLSPASLMLACIWVVCPAAAAPPPIEDFPAGGMLPRHVEQMKACVSYWVKTIRDAKEDIAVVKARTGLQVEYKRMNAMQAGYTFVEHVSTYATPLLAGGLDANDPLRQVKEINLAIALAGMPQVTIQPALDAMVAHPTNAAVRYFGWKGYRAARTRLFAQGMRWTRNTFKSVDNAARKETSPQVLSVLFRALEMELRPAAVQEEIWDFAQRRTLQALRRNWLPWCKRLRKGDKEICEALRRATRVIRANADWIAQNKQQKKMALQMLVDLAFHAAKAYAGARKDGRTGEALRNLLRDCERALNTVKKINKRFIRKPLTDPRASANPQWVLWWVDPRTNENCGVLAWVELLKADGVVPPKDIQVDNPKKAPATKPATAPS